MLQYSNHIILILSITTLIIQNTFSWSSKFKASPGLEPIRSISRNRVKMDVIKSQQISSRSIDKVVVHPLVLRSVVNRYNRVARDTGRRIVGALLGASFKGTVFVTNSFDVGLEEEDRDPSLWLIDFYELEAYSSMFGEINAMEQLVGWYSTGPELKENDLDIDGVFNHFFPTPVLVIIDVQPKELGIPTKAYYAVEEVKENATQKSQKMFVHVPPEIAAHEIEEIGVEHLRRDVKDKTVSTLDTEVTGKLAASRVLDARQEEMKSYLDQVIEGKLPLKHDILDRLQEVVFWLLPSRNVSEVVKVFPVKTNIMIMFLDISSLIRDVVARHKEQERAEDSKRVQCPQPLDAKRYGSLLSFFYGND